MSREVKMVILKLWLYIAAILILYRTTSRPINIFTFSAIIASSSLLIEQVTY
jgi:hypothetical protein